ncbi:MAG: hypothetical protein WC269_03035 [Candidatus Gracilibacteria bacterium]|jgi:hypothetical protein
MPYTPATNTADLIAQSNAMLSQSKAEGDKPFAGSAYDTQPQTKVNGLIATSGSARNEINQNLLKHDSLVSGLNYGTITQDKNGNTVKGPDINDPTAQAGAGFKFAYKPDGTKVQIPKDSDPLQYGMTTNAPIKTGVSQETSGSYQDAISEKEKAVQTAKDALSASTSANDPEMKSIIDDINAKMDAQVAKMNDINARYLETTRIAGTASGRQRYAPTINAGLLSTEQMDGVARVTELESQRKSLILQATQARKAGAMEEFSKTMDEIETNYNDKVQAIKDLKTATTAQEAKLTEQRQTVERENAMVEIFSQGVTNPIDIMKMMSEAGISSTSKDVSEFLKNVSVGMGGTGDVEKLTGDAKNFFILKGMNTALPNSITSLPEQDQLGAFIKWQKDLVTSPKAQSVGTGSTAGTTGEAGFEQFSKEQIALAAIPTQLRNSDTELKRYIQGIRQGLDQGLSPYDISDQLIGYKIEKPDEFSNGMRQYISQSNLGNQEISNVARLINSGNKAGAITVIENKALDTQKKLDPDGYVGESTARYYSEKVAQIKKTLVDNGLWDAVGPVEGGIQNITGNIPFLSFARRAEAAKVQAQVASLVAEMRNHLCGTAVTESEKKFLEPLVASLGDKKGIFEGKLNEIKDNSLTRYNNVRSTANLPVLDEASLLNKNLRVSLYSKGLTNEDNQFEDQSESLLNTPLPSAKSSADFWGKAK